MSEPGPESLSLDDAIAAARRLRPRMLHEQRRTWRDAAERIAGAAGTNLEVLRRHPDHDYARTAVRQLVARYLHGQGVSLPEIARLLGYRDHTVVLYLVRRTEKADRSRSQVDERHVLRLRASQASGR